MLGKVEENEHGKSLIINYKPHDGQRLIHADDTRFRIVVCGRRFGKTTLALNELLKAALDNTDPLARCWYVAPNYKQAKTVAWEMIKEVIPEQLIENINESELLVRLFNRSVIELKGADSQDSLRGAKLKFVVLDEYASMRPTVWEEVIRPAMADVPGSKAIFIGTPSGFNHFKVLYDRGIAGEKDYKSFSFKTVDNPYVNPQEIAEIKEGSNPQIFRQEYEASFEQMTGSIYPMFKRSQHVIEGFSIPDEWERLVSMDWGSRNATAILFAATNPQGEIYVYDMLYDSGKTVSQWAAILNARPETEKIESWVIDPSALAQAREFGQYGIYFHSYNPDTMKKINDVTIGINLVSEYLIQNKIKIFSHCTTLIEQMEQYQWEPTVSRLGSDQRPKPLKKDDHSCFIYDTKVLTDHGYKKIGQIKAGDFVLTRQGFKEVEVSCCVGEKEVKAYMFSNGSTLVATPDHPIFMGDQKISLDSLRYMDIVDAWISPTSIGQHVLSGVKYLDQFLKDFISTIKTTIQRTIGLKISHVSQQQSMNPIMENCRSQTLNILPESDLSLSNGTDQKKEFSGIENMQKNVSSVNGNHKNIHVNIVERFSLLLKDQQRSFVIRTVNKLVVALLTKTKNRVVVSFVRKCLSAINTPLRKHVQENAVRFLASVPLGLSKVYNLQIKDVHEYFAEGLCVSNCDSLRYMIMCRPFAKEKKEEKYSGLDARSELFWRGVKGDMPREIQQFSNSDSLLFGSDVDYGIY